MHEMQSVNRDYSMCSVSDLVRLPRRRALFPIRRQLVILINVTVPLFLGH